MVEIELSAIPDTDVDVQVLASLLADFGSKYGVRAKFHTMTWGNAWNDLVAFASHGKGPDLSHIGGTWVSSLAIMNALRPFTSREVEEMGGAEAFLPPTWQSSLLSGDRRIWSVPWTGHVHVICYRKDLLRQAGVDEETAFGSIQALLETVRALRRSSLEIPFLIPFIPPPYSDLIHLAASWVCESGGDYIDAEGRKVLFNTPQSLVGLKAWLETHREVPDTYYHLSFPEVSTLFNQGRAAAIVSDNRYAASIFLGGAERIVKDNFGAALLSGIPWFGGGSFVIWKHTQGYPEREQAAVQLVKYLTGKEAQFRWAREVRSMPARLEVLDELYPPGSPLGLFNQAASSGKSYYPVPLWRRLEYQIAQALSVCLREARENPAMDSDTILHTYLDPLAERLNLTLKV